MTKREESQYNMLIQVQRIMDNNPDKWNTIPALVRYKNEIDANILALKESQKTQVQDSKAVTAAKTELKATIALKAAILAGGMSAYAAEQNDRSLQLISNQTPSGLVRLSDQQFSNPINQLLLTARGLLTELTDQGISEAQLTELETSLDDFQEMIGNPRTIRIKAALLNQSFSELLENTMIIVRDQLDKSMRRFALTDPTFYEGYERARTIVD